MQLSDFHYELPEDLIAYHPRDTRSDSRLLCLGRDSGQIEHRIFHELPDLLQPEDLLVFNNTRVIAARLLGHKETGGRVEVLIERITGPQEALAQLRVSKSPGPGTQLLIPLRDGSGDPLVIEVLGRQESFYRLRFVTNAVLPELLDDYGHMPLPPYIQREDEVSDRSRYQTVYGKHAGAVAAPTAGLHFDQALLEKLREQGIESAFVTLHVGSGTFQPVRVDNISDHVMHSEWIHVPEKACEQIAACRQRGGRVVAVGTTSVRSLESAAQRGGPESLSAYQGETDIFIYPGYEFRVVDAMVTNFHLPESTLIMLVSAFAGKDRVMAAYAEAVRERYRFFSYGDAMFIA